jgi:hypothetical protein
MAAIKHASGVKLLLKVGDGASPEQFTTYCSINAERGVQFQAGEQTFEIADCPDPEAIAWVTSEITSLRVTFSGAGTLNTPDLEEFFDWWKGGLTKNCQLVLDVPAVDGGLIFEGGFKLPNFEVTGGARGSRASVSISGASDGEVTKSANS